MTKNSPYKVIISDLDGTLLGPDHKISEFTKKIIRMIVDKGIYFIIATGRHHRDVVEIRETIGINSFLITSNGAIILDDKNKMIHRAEIDRDVVKGILDIPIDRKSIHQNIYQGDSWVSETNNPFLKDFQKEGTFTNILCNFEVRMGYDTEKIFFISDSHENLIELKHKILNLYGDSVDVTFSLPKCMEIMAKGTNKGTALETALNLIGVKPEEAIAFGDGLNDVEMLNFVGKGYLMQNAAEVVKERLPHLEIAGYNSEDAVAKKIIELFKL